MIDYEDYDDIDFTQEPVMSDKYDNCTFTRCNFNNKHVSNISFVECKFIECDLSNIKIGNTGFKDVVFENCKLLGLNFPDCNDFLFKILVSDSQLNMSSFFQMNIKGSQFINCEMHEVDFTEADLSSVLFDHCNLSNAVFEQTVLDHTDLKSSYNLEIDPERNTLKKAKFSQESALGLLSKYDIVIDKD